MSFSFSLPLIMRIEGPVPTPPATLRQQLLASVASTNPDYTANLPGSLIEDIADTDVASAGLIDQARVETINSLDPFACNAFLLNQLGSGIYGVNIGDISNTSVFVVFTGTVGFVIAQGFVVSDGSNQYVIKDGGIVGSGGTTPNLFAQAVNSGSFPVPADSVTTLITSVPGGITLSVNNPLAGTPGGAAETETSYRARVLQAGLASAQGTPRFLKTKISQVDGVDPRLIAYKQLAADQWQIIVGGNGDPYQIGNAIFRSLFNINDLVGSAINPARDITVALNDSPDTYSIIFVVPPAQTVGIAVTWNTPATSFVSPQGIAQLATAALIDYINSIKATGIMNVFEMINVFQQSISAILDPALLTRLLFSVTIDGIAAPPVTGTGIIEGDAEGYFVTDTSQITITQG